MNHLQRQQARSVFIALQVIHFESQKEILIERTMLTIFICSALAAGALITQADSWRKERTKSRLLHS
jgi:hypothetical protein